MISFHESGSRGGATPGQWGIHLLVSGTPPRSLFIATIHTTCASGLLWRSWRDLLAKFSCLVACRRAARNVPRYGTRRVGDNRTSRPCGDDGAAMTAIAALRGIATAVTDFSCDIVGRRYIVRGARFVLWLGRLDGRNDMRLNGETSLQGWALKLFPPGKTLHVLDIGRNLVSGPKH